MANLEVSFRGKLLTNGETVTGSQKCRHLSVSWDPIEGIEYYRLKIEHLASGKVYLHRTSIGYLEELHDDLVSEPEDLVPEARRYDEGDYLVSLYGVGEHQSDNALRTAFFSIAPPSTVPTRPRRRSPMPCSYQGRYEHIVSSRLPLEQRKYCACLVHREVEQRKACHGRRWDAKLGKGADSPRGSPCLPYYILEALTDEELLAVAEKHGIYSDNVLDRNDLIKLLKENQQREDQEN